MNTVGRVRGLFLALAAWLCLVAATVSAAPAPLSSTNTVTSTNSASTTNGMVIVCDNDAILSNRVGLVVFQGNVRVLDWDSSTYMECDRLTLTFQTNATKQVRTNKNTVLNAGGLASIAAQTNENSHIDTIYADGRVMIVTKDQQVLGDRAVYYATNDIMVITGENVIIADARFVFLGTQAIYDRANEAFRSVGQTVVESFSSGGTNKSSLFNRPGSLGKQTNAPPKNTNRPPIRSGGK